MEVFDIHSHVIYGVDDGSKDLDMSIAMLKMASDNGITSMILTPHHHKGRMDKDVDTLKMRFDDIVSNNPTSIKLYLGSELFSDSYLVDELNNGSALTINGTRYVLVEFYPNVSYKDIEAQFRALQMSGYRPIIAHIERYACFLNDPYLVEDLVNMGVKVQINASSLKDFKIKLFIKKLLKYELVDFVGSDAHNTTSRSPEIKKYIDYIEKKVSKQYANDILHDNAYRIIHGEDF